VVSLAPGSVRVHLAAESGVRLVPVHRLLVDSPEGDLTCWRSLRELAVTVAAAVCLAGCLSPQPWCRWCCPLGEEHPLVWGILLLAVAARRRVPAGVDERGGRSGCAASPPAVPFNRALSARWHSDLELGSVSRADYSLFLVRTKLTPSQAAGLDSGVRADSEGSPGSGRCAHTESSAHSARAFVGGRPFASAPVARPARRALAGGHPLDWCLPEGS